MTIYVVADLHGAPEDLNDAVPAGATLVLLGDLINFLDYGTMSGILTDVFPTEAVAEVVELRAAGEVAEARRLMRERSLGREEEIRESINERASEQYEEVFAHLPDPTYLILGNVDNPSIAASFVAGAPGVHDADGRSIELEGERWGFVGGGLPTPMQVAGEIPEEQMRAKLHALGDVDIVCSHVPPDVPELCWDSIANKAERGSVDLLRFIEDVQPRRAYFGHVHQPLVSTTHIGRTCCINAGYFRATKRAFPHTSAAASA